MTIDELFFCGKCSEKIVSHKLNRFWKNLCVHYLLYNDWSKFSLLDIESLRMVDRLEEKFLVLSTDREKSILVRPLGLNHFSDRYIICIDPTSHSIEDCS
jgi:hypothetical protein